MDPAGTSRAAWNPRFGGRVLVGVAIAYSPNYIPRVLRWAGIEWGPQGPPSVVLWNWVAVGVLVAYVFGVEGRGLDSILLTRPDPIGGTSYGRWRSGC